MLSHPEGGAPAPALFSDRLITVAELATFLGLSAATVASDVCRRPDVLPPIVRLPGHKRPLFRLSQVEAWLDRFTAPIPPVRPGSVGSRKGRPTKREKAEADRLGLTVPALRARRAGGAA